MAVAPGLMWLFSCDGHLTNGALRARPLSRLWRAKGAPTGLGDGGILPPNPLRVFEEKSKCACSFYKYSGEREGLAPRFRRLRYPAARAMAGTLPR